MEYLEKNKPLNLVDFIGNSLVLKRLHELLQGQYMIMIMGVSGCGKTTLAKLFLDKQDKDVLRIGSDDINDTVSIKSLVTNFIKNRNIESFLSKRDKVIFFDDVDISLTFDKSVGVLIGEIIETCKKDTRLSLLVTSNVSEDKKITDLKKQLEVLRIYNPPVKDSYVYVMNMLDKDGVEYDASGLLKLAKTYDGNIRHILLNLHNLSNPEREKSHMEFFDKTSFEVVKQLLYQSCPLKDISRTSDNSMVPLILLENFPKELFKKKVDKPQSLDALINVTDGFVASEEIEKYMYQNTDWTNYDLVTLLRCFPINYHLNMYPVKTTKTNIKAGDSLVFTQLLTKTSQKQVFYKKLSSIQSSVGIYDIYSASLYYDALCQYIITNQDKVKEFCKKLANKFAKEELSIILSYLTHLDVLDKKLSAKIKRYM